MMEEREELLFTPEDLAGTPEPEAPQSAPEMEAARDGADEADLPWLTLAERFPEFGERPVSRELCEAVRAGERPVEAYLRLENERLTKQMELVKRELRLRDAATGSSQSAAAPEPADPFLEGLAYMR